MTTTEPKTSTVETDEEGEAIDVGSFVSEPDLDAVEPDEEVERPESAVVERPASDAAVLAVVDDEPTVALDAFPSGDEFRSLLTMARVLADSDLVPRDLRRKPHDVALVLLTGRELGIAPTAALRSCYVVDGKVTLAPALKQALVTDRGLGKVRPGPDNNADHATWIAYEQDGRGGWMEAGRLTVTMADMESAQNGSRGRLVDKDNWKGYPARMLSARCRGWLIDDLWPEVAFGLYSPDEVGAFTDEDGTPIDVASYENVPDGFVPAAAAPPETISQEQVDEMTARIEALPAEAAEELRSKWKQAKYRGGAIGKLEAGMEAGAYRMAAAVLSGVESMVRAGRFGEEAQTRAKAADAGEPIEEEVDELAGLCDGCEKPEDACICPPPDDVEPEAEEARIVVDGVEYAPGEEPM